MLQIPGLLKEHGLDKDPRFLNADGSLKDPRSLVDEGLIDDLDAPKYPHFRVRIEIVADKNRPPETHRLMRRLDAALDVMTLMENGTARDKAIKQISETTKIRVADIRKSLKILEYLDPSTD